MCGNKDAYEKWWNDYLQNLDKIYIFEPSQRDRRRSSESRSYKTIIRSRPSSQVTPFPFQKHRTQLEKEQILK